MKFRKLLHFWRGRWRGSLCTKSLTFQYAFVWTLLPTWSGFKICNLKSLEEIQSEKTVFSQNYILFSFLILVRGSDGLHLAVSFTEEPNCFHLRSNCSQLVAHTKMLLNSSYQKTFWGWLKGRSLGTYLWQASKQTEIWSTLRSVGGYWATINRSTSTLGSTRLLN